MEVEIRSVEGIAVLAPSGELDREGCEALERAVAEHAAGDRPRVVIDLSRCRRVGSDALRRFVALARRLEGRGGGFALCGATGDAARALEMGGITRLCRVLPSPEDALAALSADRRIELLAALVCELLGREGSGART